MRKNLPVRKNVRLNGYDYSQNGAYFITVCTKDKHEMLGEIVVGDAALGVPLNAVGVPTVKLTEYGELIKTYIDNITYANPDVFVPKYVIMPNHIHLILIVNSHNIKNRTADINRTPRADINRTPRADIDGTPWADIDGTPRAASPTKALIPKIVNSIKGLSSKKAGFSLWQRSFHDHIIRDEQDYLRISEYIENNPAKWQEDCYFVQKSPRSASP